MSSASSPSSSSPSPLQGSCFCARTTYELHLIDDQTTPPSSNLTLSAYCHCSGCQRMNGAPFIHTTHWKEHALVWGDVKPARFSQKEGKFKLRCDTCGSPMGTWNENKKEWSLWPSTLARDDALRPIGIEHMKPTAHMFYGPWRAMDVSDELGKWVGYEGKSEKLV